MNWQAWATLGAAIIAAVAAVYNASRLPRSTRETEHIKWLREQRLQTYARFVTAVQEHFLRQLTVAYVVALITVHIQNANFPPEEKRKAELALLNMQLGAIPEALSSMRAIIMAAQEARFVATPVVEGHIDKIERTLLRMSEKQPVGEQDVTDMIKAFTVAAKGEMASLKPPSRSS